MDGTLAVKPSEAPNEGIPAFLLTVKFKNNGNKKISLHYKEGITPNFVSMEFQRGDTSLAGIKKLVTYVPMTIVNKKSNFAQARFDVVSNERFLSYPQSGISRHDLTPPTLFIQSLTQDLRTDADANELKAESTILLKPGEVKMVQMAIGYLYPSDSLTDIINKMTVNTDGDFDQEWKKLLPSLNDEKDTVLKREMIWDAYCLEAMATYNSFSNETEIPQGTSYDYDWGWRASARDQLQHGLPLCYYNPALAKSNLKYIMKRMTPWGEVRLIEVGFGMATPLSFNPSDQQLFFLQMVNEYLRITKDYSFLKEKVNYYPSKLGSEGSVVNFIENAYLFLRDEIGTGSHGLIRLKISDWNDSFYAKGDVPYVTMFYDTESHMNSAMAIVIVGDLIKNLEKAESAMPDIKTGDLRASLTKFRERQLNAFLKDLDDRPFSRRAYIENKAIGEDDMWLEPQGYVLQIPEIPLAKRKAIFEQIEKRLMKNEVLGARQQEVPSRDIFLPPGSRENGGFWYSLNGPVIIGVNSFDKEKALNLLKKMTFDNLSAHFPEYWTSYWTAADNIESSLLPSEGLTDQGGTYWEFPAFCAHAHAWPLYCYFRIKECE